MNVAPSKRFPQICLVLTFQKIMENNENNVNEKCSGKCNCKILSIIAIALSVISIIFSSIVLVRGNRRPRDFYGMHPGEMQGYMWENNFYGNPGGNCNQCGNRNWNNNNFGGNYGGKRNNNFNDRPGQSNNNNSTNNGGPTTAPETAPPSSNGNQNSPY